MSLIPQELQETAVNERLNVSLLKSAIRKAWREKKKEMGDLDRVKDAAQRKDLAKLLKSLKNLSDDAEKFEDLMVKKSVGRIIKEENEALKDIQKYEDLLRYLSQVGVPPAVINQNSDFILTILGHWLKDIRNQQALLGDLDRKVQTLMKQAKSN